MMNWLEKDYFFVKRVNHTVVFTQLYFASSNTLNLDLSTHTVNIILHHNLNSQVTTILCSSFGSFGLLLLVPYACIAPPFPAGLLFRSPKSHLLLPSLLLSNVPKGWEKQNCEKEMIKQGDIKLLSAQEWGAERHPRWFTERTSQRRQEHVEGISLTNGKWSMTWRSVWLPSFSPLLSVNPGSCDWHWWRGRQYIHHHCGPEDFPFPRWDFPLIILPSLTLPSLFPTLFFSLSSFASCCWFALALALALSPSLVSPSLLLKHLDGLL